MTVTTGLRRWTAGDGVVGQVVHTLAARVILVAAGVVTSILVARALGPDGRGIYIVATTITGIGVQLGNLGLSSANTYHVARDRSSLSALVGNSLAVGLVGSCAAVAAIGAFFWVFPSVAPVRGSLLYLALASVPLGLTTAYLQNLLIGLGRIRDVNRAESVTRICGVGALALIVAAGAADARSMFLVGFAVVPLSLMWMWLQLRPLIDGRPTLSARLFRRSLGYGLKAWSIALFSFLVIRSDLLIVRQLRGSEETGLYSIAVTLADFTYLLPMVVATVIFPKLTAIDDLRHRWIETQRTAAVVAATMVILAVLAVPIASSAINIIYGQDFARAAPAFLWLLPGIVFLSVETIIAQFLAASGMPRSLIAAWATAFVLNVVLTIALVPEHGFLGASIASTISYGAMLIAVVVIARRVYPGEAAPQWIPKRWRGLAALVPRSWLPAVSAHAQRWLRRGRFLPHLAELGQVRVRSLYGSTFELSFPEDGDFQSIYVIGTYEAGTSELCRRVLRPGDAVIDVGANIGWYAQLFDRVVGPAGRVYAFEPVPETFQRLCANAHAAGIDTSYYMQVAVGASEGTTTVRRYRGAPHGHATTVADPDAEVEAMAEVPTTSLDAHLLAQDRHEVTLVKVDVEGAEVAVLEGASKLMSSLHPPMWVLEVNVDAVLRSGHSIFDLLVRMKERGYGLVRVPSGWGKWRMVASAYDCRHGDNVLLYRDRVHADRLRRLLH